MHAARELEKLGVKMIEFTQNTMRITADTAYRGHIMAHTLRNYPGSGDLKQHVMHAVAVERGNGTIRLDKRKTSAHIDAAVADSMCCYGVMEHRLRFERLARQGNRPAPEVVPQRSPWSQSFRHGVGYGRSYAARRHPERGRQVWHQPVLRMAGLRQRGGARLQGGLRAERSGVGVARDRAPVRGLCHHAQVLADAVATLPHLVRECT